jgi:hypothetical protein
MPDAIRRLAGMELKAKKYFNVL